MRILLNIDVPSLEPAISFYCAALGLEHARTLDHDVAELKGGSSVIYLLHNPPGSAASAFSGEVRQYSRHWTPVHLDFVVSDLAVATERALKAGARQESSCVEWRGSKCVNFGDPFGHGFCLIEFAAETYSDMP